MENSKVLGRYVTTVQIPIQLREEIKAAGMTVNGALMAGWEAMQERKGANDEIRDLRANLNRYRDAWLKLQRRVNELEASNGQKTV